MKNLLIKNLPNFLTISRLFLLIPSILLFPHEGIYRIISFIIFIFAFLSDWLDGIVARRFSLESNLGKFLDPLIDKIFILTFFIFLTYFDGDVFPFWLIWLIFLREFSVTVVRIYYYHKIELKAIQSGKFKTAFQFTAIVLVYILLIIKDQLALHINSFHLFLKTDIIESMALWKNIFGNFLGTFLVYIPTLSLYIVTILTLYSGFIYFYKNRHYLQ